MKSIGFKNFRKFIEFPELKFNDITLMVGANNSGKSTLVKAVLLVIDYLKNQQNQFFSFTTENVKDVNIVSFERARCKFQPDDVIYFNCSIAPDFNVSLKISGDKDSIVGNVEAISITDIKKGLQFEFNFAESVISFSKRKTMKEQLSTLTSDIEEKCQNIQIRIDNAVKEIKKGNTNFLEIINELNKEKKVLLDAANNNRESYADSISLQLEVEMPRSSSNGNFIDYTREFLNAAEDERNRLAHLKNQFNETEDNAPDDIVNKFEELNLIFSVKSEVINFIEEFIRAINTHYYYYWSAETQKQSALFSIRDKNNALAQAIHDFCKLKIMRGDDEWLFVENQMHEFEIGERFKLVPHAGEAYECEIIEESECSVSLADKGMGTIQLMTLLFRLAAIIKQQKSHKDNITLIIEEPELNLHPKLHSKLADLFGILNDKHGLKFIIETHSEYLIRRTQVMVAGKDFKDGKDLLEGNSFEVYYFPLSSNPYSMGYCTDGKFINEFDSGFFDVADSASMELFLKSI